MGIGVTFGARTTALFPESERLSPKCTSWSNRRRHPRDRQDRREQKTNQTVIVKGLSSTDLLYYSPPDPPSFSTTTRALATSQSSVLRLPTLSQGDSSFRISAIRLLSSATLNGLGRMGTPQTPLWRSASAYPVMSKVLSPG